MSEPAPKKQNWFESAVVHAGVIGALILTWQYAPIDVFHKVVSAPALAVLILAVYSLLRGAPAPQGRKGWRRYFLRGGIWQIISIGILIAVSATVIFYEPVRGIAPTWMRVFALVMLFAGPFTIAAIVFETLYNMAFPPKDVRAGDPSNLARDALASNLTREGVAKPQPTPNPDTAQSED